MIIIPIIWSNMIYSNINVRGVKFFYKIQWENEKCWIESRNFEGYSKIMETAIWKKQ